MIRSNQLGRHGGWAMIAALCLSLAGIAATCIAAPATQPTLSDQVDRLIKQFDSESVQDRESAAEAASHLPTEALPLIEAAAQRGDLAPEARVQLASILRALRQAAGRVTRYQSYVEFFRQHLIGDYDRAGQKNPAWDDSVHQLLNGLATKFADDVDGRENDADATPLAAAIRKSGCIDPLAKLVCQIAMGTTNRPAEIETVCDAVQAGPYSSYVKTFSLAWAARYHGPAGAGKGKVSPDQYLHRAIQSWADVLKDEPSLPSDIALFRFNALFTTSELLKMNRKSVYDELDAVLAKSMPEGSLLRLNVKGSFLIDYAWDARGSGWANTVTQDGWQRFTERLIDADKTLSSCYELFPDDWHAPTKMLSVELGQGRGRPRMETWFARAMRANPGCTQACDAKMWYLAPRWYGSAAEQLAFGRECLAAGQFDSRVPLMVIRGHEFVATPAPWGSVAPNPYYAQADVWADVRAAYEGYLAQNPDGWKDRADYARLAWTAGKWAEASVLFAQLDNGPARYRSSEMDQLMRQESTFRSKQPADFDPTAETRKRDDSYVELDQDLTVGEYNSTGKKDARWDEPARTALAAMARWMADDAHRDFSESDTELDASQKAIDAGCDDPLVRFAHSLAVDRFVTATDDAFRSQSLPDALALAGSNYSATLKSCALVWGLSMGMLWQTNGHPPAAEQRANVDVAWSMVLQSVVEKKAPDDAIAACAEGIGRCYLKLGDDRDALFKRLSADLIKSGLTDRARRKFEIFFIIDSARLFYAIAGKNGVKPKSVEIGALNQRLAEGRALCHALWLEHPSDPVPAMYMMHLIGGSTRSKADLDFWFRQAIVCSPSDHDVAEFYFQNILACANSYEPMNAFAQQCAVVADYHSQIPFLQVSYWDQAARWVKDAPPATQPSNEYLARPTVWTQIAAVYDAYLTRYPLDSDRRSEYASYACRAGRWSTAAEQFKILGDHVRPRAFGSQARFAACQKAVQSRSPATP